MSTGRHINKICAVVAAVMLILTSLFMCGESLGISVAPKTVRYESTLFDTSRVHQIDIVMDDWDSFIENCENEEYSTCTAVVDGEKHSNTAIRAKGNTSLSSVRSSGSQRYSFKLEFDHYEQAKMLDGLDKLCLNNLIQDNTMMKDYLVYRMMADFGVDAPLCSFVYLTVNGEDWGLYLAVEGIEDSFLSRNYGSEAGDLYKPDSMSFGGGRGNGKDFNFDDLDFGDDGEEKENQDQDNKESEIQGQESKAQEDQTESSGQKQALPTQGSQQGGFNPFGQFPGQSDGQFPTQADGQFPGLPGGSSQSDESSSGNPFSGQPGGGMFGGMFGGMGSDDVKLKYIDDDPDSYSNIFDNAKTDVSSSDKKRLIRSLEKLSSYTDLEDVLDMDEVLRYFVVHNFVCNGDSYTGAMIHNYYLHESDGKLGMIPWDYNLAFGTFQGNDASGTVNTSIDSPLSGGNMDDRPMLGWIFSDESYTEQYHELFAEFLEKWFTDGELEQLISETAEMIRPYVEKNPTKFCTTEEFDKGVEALSQFVSLRAEAVGNQLEGNDTAVETGSLNLSDMGTMNGGMDGGNSSGGNGQSSLPSGGDNTQFTPPSGGDGQFTLPSGDGSTQFTPPSGGDSSQQFSHPSGDDNTQFTPPSDGDTSQQFTPPSGDTQSGPADTGEVETETSDSQETEDKTSGREDTANSPTKDQGSKPDFRSGAPDFIARGNSEKDLWMLVGISVFVLIAGLIIVIKKK